MIEYCTFEIMPKSCSSDNNIIRQLKSRLDCVIHNFSGCLLRKSTYMVHRKIRTSRIYDLSKSCHLSFCKKAGQLHKQWSEVGQWKNSTTLCWKTHLGIEKQPVTPPECPCSAFGLMTVTFGFWKHLHSLGFVARVGAPVFPHRSHLVQNAILPATCKVGILYSYIWKLLQARYWLQ